MAESTPRRVNRDESMLATVEKLAEWLIEYSDVLGALVTLRSLGSAGEDAVRAVRAVPAIERIRLSWELWAFLAKGDGVDPVSTLAEYLPDAVLERARAGLWDSPPRHCGGPSK